MCAFFVCIPFTCFRVRPSKEQGTTILTVYHTSKSIISFVYFHIRPAILFGELYPCVFVLLRIRLRRGPRGRVQHSPTTDRHRSGFFQRGFCFWYTFLLKNKATLLSSDLWCCPGMLLCWDTFGWFALDVPCVCRGRPALCYKVSYTFCIGF